MNIYKPSHNWKSELKRFIGTHISPDEEEKWGNKKYLQNDEVRIYSREKLDSIARMLFMIDTSGSVSDNELSKIISESVHICQAKKIKNITYAYYDNGVSSIETIKKFNKKPQLKKITGRGGTSFEKACSDLEKIYNRKRAELTIVFTDGDTLDEVKQKPRWSKNFLFVIIDRPAFAGPDWAKTIYIDSNDV